MSEKQLIENYFKGDEKSLEILIGRYLKPVYSFIYRYVGNAQEAEDITQEVFVRTWRNLKKFDKEKSFKTWIFSIAKNASFDFLRKSRSALGGKKAVPFAELENEKEESILDRIIDPTPLPDAILEQKGITDILTKALQKISPKYRMVLFLRYNDHFTFQEIAESLGEPLNTVKSRYRRGLVILKNLFSIVKNNKGICDLTSFCSVLCRTLLDL